MVDAVGAVNAVDAIAPSQAGAQPTTDQTARFESQLQQTSLYDPPLADPQGFSADVRSFMDYAGGLSSTFRNQLEHTASTNIDLEDWPELQVLQDVSKDMRELNLTTVQFQFVAAGVEITNRNAQTLFQQS